MIVTHHRQPAKTTKLHQAIHQKSSKSGFLNNSYSSHSFPLKKAAIIDDDRLALSFVRFDYIHLANCLFVRISAKYTRDRRPKSTEEVLTFSHSPLDFSSICLRASERSNSLTKSSKIFFFFHVAHQCCQFSNLIRSHDSL